MKAHSGFLWPEDDLWARPVIISSALTDIPALLSLVPGRDLIVQAGANVGVYPILLSMQFKRVVTVEPDAENFECLMANINRHPPVVSRRIDRTLAAFGDTAAMCVVEEVDANNCGAHRIRPGDGVPVLTIDSMDLPACDCIWLDVEGSELAALKGAEQTIERFRPVIAIEDKGLEQAYGLPIGATVQWLEGIGYEQAAQIANDKVFTHTQGRTA